jgi:hypothetical protein
MADQAFRIDTALGAKERGFLVYVDPSDSPSAMLNRSLYRLEVN